MHTLGRALAALVALASAGCVKLDSYSCAQSLECIHGEVLGSCEPDGLCSFPDVTCPSGKKYGDLAGGQSGQCVGDGNGGSSSSTTVSPTTSVSASTFDPPTSSTDTPSDGTTFDATATEVGTSTSTTDPTNTTFTSDPGTTTDPDTTTGPSCGEVGEPCHNGACCGTCTTCENGTCVPASTEMAASKCGAPCSACGMDGSCVLAEAGTPCTSDCKDIVWLPKIAGSKTACFAYPEAQASSTCNDNGKCKLPDPEKCPTPEPGGGIEILECDSVCLQDASLCTNGEPVSEVKLGAYCTVDAVTDNCQASCSPDLMVLETRSCDAAGICNAVAEPCGAYYCDPNINACPNMCEKISDCVSGICEFQKCQ